MMQNKVHYFQSCVESMACDRGLIAVGLMDGNIEVCEIISGDRVRGWKGHRWFVKVLVFTSDGRFVSGSADGFMKKWDDVETRKGKLAPLERWSTRVGVGWGSSVSELADGRLVVGGTDRSVRVLDGVTGHEILACRGHTNTVRAFISLGALHAGEKGYQPAFASASHDGTIREWAFSPVGGTMSHRTVVEVADIIDSLSLSPCGHLAAVGCGGSVKLYRLPDWGQVWSVKAHENGVYSVSWSPDGRFLASGSYDRTVKILSAHTGATLRTLRGHTEWISSVFISQDGTKVLSGSSDKTVRVWRIFEHDDILASMLYHLPRSNGRSKVFANLRQKLMIKFER